MNVADEHEIKKLENQPAFTEDVYSTSPLARSLQNDEDDDFGQQVLPDLPPSHFAPPTPKAPAKAINGISWKKQRRISRRDMITLNNGEPLSFAIRKVAVELLVVAICTAMVFGFFFARQFIMERLTQDGFESLSVSSRYKQPQAVALNPSPANSSAGYQCIQTIGSWAGVTVDPAALQKTYGGRDITRLATGMEKELARAIPSKTITRKENISDYTLLTQVYNSLQQGAPVVVSCTAQDGSQPTWALVTAIDTQANALTLLYGDATTATLTSQAFIASTRHQDLPKKDFGLQLACMLGFYNKNTAFFFSAAEE